MAIRNPLEWGWEALRPISSDALARAGARLGGPPSPDALHLVAAPRVRHIGLQDLRAALRLGWSDFTAGRTDVIMLCLLYPVIGLIFGRIGLGHQLLPLLFPLAAGFALLGPLAAVGLNEMSRRREQGMA